MKSSSRKAVFDARSVQTQIPTVTLVVKESDEGAWFELFSNSTGLLSERHGGFADADEAERAGLEYVRRNESRLLHQEGFGGDAGRSGMKKAYRIPSAQEMRDKAEQWMFHGKPGDTAANFLDFLYVEGFVDSDGSDMLYEMIVRDYPNYDTDLDCADDFVDWLEMGGFIASKTASLYLDDVVRRVNADADGMWDIKVDVKQDGDEHKVTLVDRNEFVSTYNCYESFIRSSVFEPIERAVREQTGDDGFFFDAYDTITFVGVAVEGGYKLTTGIWEEYDGVHHKNYTQEISGLVGKRDGEWIWAVFDDRDEHVETCDGVEDGKSKADAYAASRYGVTASRKATAVPPFEEFEYISDEYGTSYEYGEWNEPRFVVYMDSGNGQWGWASDTDNSGVHLFDMPEDAYENMKQKLGCKIAGFVLSFDEREFVPSEWQTLGKTEDGSADVYTNGRISVYKWDDGTWSVSEEKFDTLLLFEPAYDYAGAIDNWVDDKEEGRYPILGGRKTAGLFVADTPDELIGMLRRHTDLEFDGYAGGPSIVGVKPNGEEVEFPLMRSVHRDAYAVDPMPYLYGTGAEYNESAWERVSSRMKKKSEYIDVSPFVLNGETAYEGSLCNGEYWFEIYPVDDGDWETRVVREDPRDDEFAFGYGMTPELSLQDAVDEMKHMGVTVTAGAKSAADVTDVFRDDDGNLYEVTDVETEYWEGLDYEDNTYTVVDQNGETLYFTDTDLDCMERVGGKVASDLDWRYDGDDYYQFLKENDISEGSWSEIDGCYLIRLDDGIIAVEPQGGEWSIGAYDEGSYDTTLWGVERIPGYFATPQEAVDWANDAIDWIGSRRLPKIASKVAAFSIPEDKRQDVERRISESRSMGSSSIDEIAEDVTMWMFGLNWVADSDELQDDDEEAWDEVYGAVKRLVEDMDDRERLFASRTAWVAKKKTASEWVPSSADGFYEKDYGWGTGFVHYDDINDRGYEWAVYDDFGPYQVERGICDTADDAMKASDECALKHRSASAKFADIWPAVGDWNQVYDDFWELLIEEDGKVKYCANIEVIDGDEYYATVWEAVPMDAEVFENYFTSSHSLDNVKAWCEAKIGEIMGKTAKSAWVAKGETWDEFLADFARKSLLYTYTIPKGVPSKWIYPIDQLGNEYECEVTQYSEGDFECHDYNCKKLGSRTARMEFDDMADDYDIWGFDYGYWGTIQSGGGWEDVLYVGSKVGDQGPWSWRVAEGRPDSDSSWDIVEESKSEFATAFDALNDFNSNSAFASKTAYVKSADEDASATIDELVDLEELRLVDYIKQNGLDPESPSDTASIFDYAVAISNEYEWADASDQDYFVEQLRNQAEYAVKFAKKAALSFDEHNELFDEWCDDQHPDPSEQGGVWNFLEWLRMTNKEASVGWEYGVTDYVTGMTGYKLEQDGIKCIIEPESNGNANSWYCYLYEPGQSDFSWTNWYETLDEAKENCEEQLMEYKAGSKEASGWESGVVTVNGNSYEFQAKVYDEPSEFGINGGRVSKLVVKRHEDSGWANPVLSYDRGWDIEPSTDEEGKILDEVLGLYKEGSRKMAEWKKEPSGFGYDWYVLDLGNGDQAIVEPEGGEWGGTIMVDGQDIELDTLGFELYDEYDAQAAAETWLDNNGYGYRYASKRAMVDDREDWDIDGDEMFYDGYDFNVNVKLDREDGIADIDIHYSVDGFGVYTKVKSYSINVYDEDEAIYWVSKYVDELFEQGLVKGGCKTADVDEDTYDEAFEKLLQKYDYQIGLGINIQDMSRGFHSPVDLGVNWAGKGTQSVADTREFANKLLEACDDIEAFQYNGETVIRASKTAAWDWAPDDGFSGAPTHYDGQYAYVLAEPGEYYDNGWCVQVFDTEDEYSMDYGEMYDELGPFDSAEQAKQYAENNKVGSRKTAWTLDWPKLDDVVSVYEKNDWGTGEATGYEIGWSSIGAVDIEDAREFAQRILEVCDAPQRFASRKHADGFGHISISEDDLYYQDDMYRFDVGDVSGFVSESATNGWEYYVYSYERGELADGGFSGKEEALDAMNAEIEKHEGSGTFFASREGASISGRGTTPGGISYEARVPTGFVDGGYFMEPSDKYGFEDFVDSVGLDAASISKYLEENRLYNVFSDFDGTVLRDNGKELVIQLCPEGSTLKLTKEGSRKGTKGAKARIGSISDAEFAELVDNTLGAMMDYLEDGFGNPDPEEECRIICESVAAIMWVEITPEEEDECVAIVLDELGL